MAKGLDVPIPTFPPFVTTKLVPVDDPIANAGAVPSPTTGLMDSFAHGVVVPIPIDPVDVIVVVAVAPNWAKLAERSDDDAFVNLFRPDQKFESDSRVEDAEDVIHVFAIEKHPVVMLKPTFEVEVA